MRRPVPPLLLLVLLLPAVALAQEAWTVTSVEGSAVMGEISPLTFEVRNAATSTRHVNEVSLAVDQTAYDVDGGDAPSGWTVSTIDRKERRITYRASGIDCARTPVGIAPGGVARFTLRLVGKPANVDITDALAQSNSVDRSSAARNVCSGTLFSGNASQATWKRVGLSATLTAQPRTLQVGGEVTLQLVLVNRSLQTQSGISLSGLSVTGGAAFTQVAPVSPATLSLASGATGSFTVRMRATSVGTAFFRALALNATASSPQVSSLQVDVSSFPALAEVLPSNIIAGDTVTVRLVVSNPSTTTYRDVTPRTPVFVGSAVATLTKAPSPGRIASLTPGTSASFVWKYQVGGFVGATYAFELQADAVRDGAPIATSRVGSGQGRIVEHRLSVEPASVLGGSTSRTLRYTVYNGGSLEIRKVVLLPPDAAFFTVSPTAPFANDTSGWTASIVKVGNANQYQWQAPAGQAITSGQQRTFSIDYSAIGAVTRDTAFLHSMELTQVSSTESHTLRVEAPVTVFLNRVIPEVEGLVALSGPQRNTLMWTNPSEHDGVLILRAVGAAPGTLPEPGRKYAVGETLGNARVVYTDEVSVASSFADTGLTDGTAYHYRVFNHDALYRYSPGNAPQSLGLKSVPTSRVPGQPLWCYSVGFSTLQQPITELGKGIFSANTSGRVTANLYDTSSAVFDGNERWRPVQLQGAVQSRFPIVPLHGKTGQYILTGDQAGYPYALSADTGEVLWKGALLGTLQSFPVVQLYDYADTAYRAAHPNRDLAFFATRLSTGTNNKVVALNAGTGQPVWTYAPGDLGMVSGGMLVDYTYNRIYVGSRSEGNTLASLRVLNSLTGVEVARLSLGDIDFGIIRDISGKQAYVTASDGTIHGVDMATMGLAWSVKVASRPSTGVPAFSHYARPVTGGFIVSTLGASDAGGTVARYTVKVAANGSTSVALLWSTPIASPSGTFSHTDSTSQRLYVGSKDEKIHELDFATGANLKQVALPGALAIGTPTVDRTVTPARLHAGTQDGRICAFPVPFP